MNQFCYISTCKYYHLATKQSIVVYRCSCIMDGGQIFIDLRTSVTTCGSHNGIVVYSGVIQGNTKTSDLFYSPYSNTPISPIQITSIPSSSVEPYIGPENLSPLLICDTSNPQEKPSSPQSPTYSFGKSDSPPNEFIDHLDRIHLNVFQVIFAVFFYETI